MRSSRRTVGLTGLLGVAGLLSAGPAFSNTIAYNDYMAYQSMTIGGVETDCAVVTDPGCAFIAIVGVGDTSTVTAFSVPGATGFRNTLSSASISVSFNDGTSWGADIDLSFGGLYVSVDQSNGGAGFSSAASPTYPLATYGSGFSSYDLASDFFHSGFGPFCAVMSVCRDGSPLYATDGTEFRIRLGRAPAYSSFSSTVAPAPQPVDEPSTITVLVLGLGTLVGVRRLAG